MPSNKLTTHQVKSAKPREKPYKIFDGHGLYLNIAPTGTKSWRWQHRVDGKQRPSTLGRFPDMSLAAAREARRAAAGDLTNIASRITLRSVSETYWSSREDLSAGYLKTVERAMEKHIYPTLGDRPISGITLADLMGPLDVMNHAGLFVYVRKTRMWLDQVFAWAVHREYTSRNPAAEINARRAFGRRETVSFAAVDLDGVSPLLHRLALEAPILSVHACHMLALTWARSGEVRRMRWDEIEGDLWRIPAEKMKRSRDHLVPLSRQALKRLSMLEKMRISDTFVFPNDRRPDRPQSENAVLYLLHRIGYQGKMTAHGWRSVGSTWGHENGFDTDHIERQLAHVHENKVKSVYNRAKYLKPRRQMLQAWADWLDVQAQQPL